MKVVIIDDEPNSIASLEALLYTFALDADVIGSATSVKAAVKLLSDENPDLVFLDVELGDGLGFDVLKYFHDPGFATIFVTAYDHYAIDAIKVKAYDYILKPIDPDDLEAALHRFRQESDDTDNAPVQLVEKFSVPTQNGMLILNFTDVVRLQSDNNYTHLYTADGTVLVTKTLKKFEVSLPTQSFLRVHQRHIVNIHRVKEYSRSDGGFLLMSTGHKVPVSKAKRGLVEKTLRQYARQF